MKTSPVTHDDLHGVLAVPPLPRKSAKGQPIDFAENDKLMRHMVAGGLTRFLYGGNAFLYHITLAEYDELLGWLNGLPDGHWAIPSIGPSFGRAIDQAAILRRYKFPCVMALPCADPRDAAGLEAGLRDIADAAGCGLVLYLKEENNFGNDKEAGLDVVARLVDAKICVAIKYAVVRNDPRQDAYLDGLLKRVDRRLVVSGIGERPAVIHMRDFKLPGFTTGSGCLAPALSQAIFTAGAKGDFVRGDELRSLFIPHEDKRDAWGPARVLHAAMELAGVAASGPIPPFVSALSETQRGELAPVARDLYEHELMHRKR